MECCQTEKTQQGRADEQKRDLCQTRMMNKNGDSGKSGLPGFAAIPITHAPRYCIFPQHCAVTTRLACVPPANPPCGQRSSPLIQAIAGVPIQGAHSGKREAPAVSRHRGGGTRGKARGAAEEGAHIPKKPLPALPTEVPHLHRRHNSVRALYTRFTRPLYTPTLQLTHSPTLRAACLPPGVPEARGDFPIGADAALPRVCVSLVHHAWSGGHGNG